MYVNRIYFFRYFCMLCFPFQWCFPYYATEMLRNQYKQGLFYHRKGKRGRQCLPLTFPALVSLGGQDLTAIVVTASLASSVGLDGFAALGADGDIGSGQLPVTATTLIATGLRHFTLRDSHGDTSLVKLLFTAFVLIISSQEAASKQQVGDRSPSGKYRLPRSDFCRSRSRDPCSRPCTAAWNPYSARIPCG